MHMILQVKSDQSVSENYALSTPLDVWIFFTHVVTVGGIEYTPSMSQTQFSLVYEGILTCMDQKDASFRAPSSDCASCRRGDTPLISRHKSSPTSRMMCRFLANQWRGERRHFEENIYLSLCVSVLAFDPVLLSLHRRVEPQRK